MDVQSKIPLFLILCKAVFKDLVPYREPEERTNVKQKSWPRASFLVNSLQYDDIAGQDGK